MSLPAIRSRASSDEPATRTSDADSEETMLSSSSEASPSLFLPEAPVVGLSSLPPPPRDGGNDAAATLAFERSALVFEAYKSFCNLLKTPAAWPSRNSCPPLQCCSAWRVPERSRASMRKRPWPCLRSTMPSEILPSTRTGLTVRVGSSSHFFPSFSFSHCSTVMPS